MIGVVYDNNKGEFRIHTNKDGVRLFIRFTNGLYTGYHNDYITRINKKLQRYNLFHAEDFKKVQSYYHETLVRPTLVDALNAHIEKMTGDVHDQVNDLESLRIQEASYSLLI